LTRHRHSIIIKTMAKAKSSKEQLNISQEFRKLGVFIEHVDEKVGLIAEQHFDIKKDTGSIKKTLESHTEMIGNLTVGLEVVKGDLGAMKKTQESHTEMIGDLAVDLTIVKEDVSFIKNSLKKKVDYDEFSALERRVLLLEKRR